MHRISFQRAAVLAPAAALVVLASACGGSADSRSASSAGANARCAPPGDSAVALATTEYLKGITPTPLRFLVVFSGDSALPDAGRAALQDKGPTYLYSPDPAQKSKLEAKLAAFGDSPTLLVLYRGTRQSAPGLATFRFSGRFVGGKNDGTPAPSRAVHLQCIKGGWAFARTEEEHTS